MFDETLKKEVVIMVFARLQAGPGGVPIELIKHGSDMPFDLLAYINIIWTTEFSKMETERVSNYRVILVINSAARVYGKIQNRGFV